MKKVAYLLILITIVGVIAYASKPSDEKCISQGRTFATRYLLNNHGHNSDTVSVKNEFPANVMITVEDHILYKSIVYTVDGSSTDIGSAYFGNIKLSHSTRE